MMYMYGAGNKKFSSDKKRKNDPSIMAVSQDGKSAYYYYCPAEYRAWGCIDNNTVNKAERKCEKFSNFKSPEGKCFEKCVSVVPSP